MTSIHLHNVMRISITFTQVVDDDDGPHTIREMYVTDGDGCTTRILLHGESRDDLIIIPNNPVVTELEARKDG